LLWKTGEVLKKEKELILGWGWEVLSLAIEAPGL
jgi:hypothetical protein